MNIPLITYLFYFIHYHINMHLIFHLQYTIHLIYIYIFLNHVLYTSHILCIYVCCIWSCSYILYIYILVTLQSYIHISYVYYVYMPHITSFYIYYTSYSISFKAHTFPNTSNYIYIIRIHINTSIQSTHDIPIIILACIYMTITT